MIENGIYKIDIDEIKMEGWVSPFELIYEDAKNTFFEKTEEHIMARVESTLGVKVDRDELIKAMNYDREQYRKGFENGYKKRDAEIVRCKDCKHSFKHSEDVYECCCFCAMTTPKFYCADGERKETE